MKRNRKLLALTLSALMTAGLLAGCSAASSTAEAGDTASAAGTAAETGNPGGEDGVFTIAYAPNESNTEAADAATVWPRISARCWAVRWRRSRPATTTPSSKRCAVGVKQ